MSSRIGVTTPKKPAQNTLNTSAEAITTPRSGFWNQKPATSPTITAMMLPLASATSTSRPITRAVLRLVTDRDAMARTVTVIAWMPALPPIEATMGIRIASATISWMVPSNSAITEAARNEVAILMSSHGMRVRAV